MADQFAFTGSFDLTPLGGDTSFQPSFSTPINETSVLKAKRLDDVTLTSDSPTAVAFGGVVNANIVSLKCDNKVTALITSADGTSQAVPVDPYFVLQSRSVPVTAISLTRVAGIETRVEVSLGEIA